MTLSRRAGSHPKRRETQWQPPSTRGVGGHAAGHDHQRWGVQFGELRHGIGDRRALQAQTERKSVADQIDPKLLTDYERIRKKTKNTPIADATDGHCGACKIALRPQFFQDLRRGDKIMFCESCGRILTYNPVIDIASEVAASQQTA